MGLTLVPLVEEKNDKNKVGRLLFLKLFKNQFLIVMIISVFALFIFMDSWYVYSWKTF